MNRGHSELARACLNAAVTGEMTFPEIVGILIDSGFDGYAMDFRRGAATYFLSDGDFIDLKTDHHFPVAEAFDAKGVCKAIREAQALVAGYTYQGFCTKVTRAGCASYLVSFLGRRVLYHGRTGETHTEHFPNTSAPRAD